MSCFLQQSILKTSWKSTEIPVQWNLRDNSICMDLLIYTSWGPPQSILWASLDCRHLIPTWMWTSLCYPTALHLQLTCLNLATPYVWYTYLIHCCCSSETQQKSDRTLYRVLSLSFQKLTGSTEHYTSFTGWPDWAVNPPPKNWHVWQDVIPLHASAMPQNTTAPFWPGKINFLLY